MALLIAAMVQAQDPVACSEVIQMEGLSQREIYNTAKNWLITSFKSAKDVIQMDDVEGGLIIGKGSTDYKNKSITYAASSGYISFVIKIQARDGRFKITVSDYRHTSTHSQYGDFWSMGLITDQPFDGKGKQGLKVYEDVYPKSITHCSYMIESIKKFFESNAIKEEDDW